MGLQLPQTRRDARLALPEARGERLDVDAAPSGSDWMWAASPIAVRDSSRCCARWLPITV